MDVDGAEGTNLHEVLKDAVKQKIEKDQAWKEAP